MFSNSCRCCLTNEGLLVALTTLSNHQDNKNLLEYLSSILATSKEDLAKPGFICLRCSKALQVAYHFISMAMASEDILRNSDKQLELEAENLMGNSKIKEEEKQELKISSNSIAESDLKKEKCPTNNKLSFENQFKIHINNMSQRPVTLNKVTKLQQIKKNPYKANKMTRKLKKSSNLQCKICQQQFENKNDLDFHNRQMHGEIVPFKCKFCNFYTCYSESILKHYTKDHGLTNVELKLYQTKEIYNSNNNNRENINFAMTFKCLECDFKSHSQSQLDDHLSAEHNIEEDKDLLSETLYNCPACYRCFTSLRAAKIHFTTCHDLLHKMENCSTQKYACDKCGKLFNLKTGLIQHKRICQPRDPVNCNFCDLLFSSVLKYEQHLQAEHSVAIRHECEMCGKTFGCSEFLAVHRKRHNERYFQCDLCPKNYINKAELKVHKQRMHSRNVQNLCSICGKIFLRLSQLRNHENKEHLKNFHQCLYCDYKSHSKFNLKIHHYKHTGKPYKCNLCPKEFVFRKDIKHHSKKLHSLDLSNEDLAEMFKQSKGYLSRFDAFSHQNINLEIAEINDLELEGELNEFGLTFQDIMEDLFDGREMHEITSF